MDAALSAHLSDETMSAIFDIQKVIYIFVKRGKPLKNIGLDQSAVEVFHLLFLYTLVTPNDSLVPTVLVQLNKMLSIKTVIT